MTIRHDRSSTSVVTTCSLCPNVWFAFAWTIEDARASAERHELDVHGIPPRDASSARRQAAYRKRVALRS